MVRKDVKADLKQSRSIGICGYQWITTPAEVQKVWLKHQDTCSSFLLGQGQLPRPAAGVNQEVIPYEFFGGDGMLTRLILKASDKAPWSDNGGSAKNPALPPVRKIGQRPLLLWSGFGWYTRGKSDKRLTWPLETKRHSSYKATINTVRKMTKQIWAAS